jgi:hypothetical protein
VASEGSILVSRNHDAFLPGAGAGGASPYLISRPQPSDPELSAALVRELTKELGEGSARAVRDGVLWQWPRTFRGA